MRFDVSDIGEPRSSLMRAHSRSFRLTGASTARFGNGVPAAASVPCPPAAATSLLLACQLRPLAPALLPLRMLSPLALVLRTVTLSLACRFLSHARVLLPLPHCFLLFASVTLSLRQLPSRMLRLSFFALSMYRPISCIICRFSLPIYHMLIILLCDQPAAIRMSRVPRNRPTVWPALPIARRASRRERPLARVHSKTSDTIARESPPRPQRLRAIVIGSRADCAIILEWKKITLECARSPPNGSDCVARRRSEPSRSVSGFC